MAFFGADPDELDKLSRDLQAASKSVAQAQSQLTAALSRASAWSGPAATRFRGDWKSLYAPNLVSAGRSLADAGTSLTLNAREQRSASSADGASAFAGASGSGGTGGASAPWGSIPGWLKELGGIVALLDSNRPISILKDTLVETAKAIGEGKFIVTTTQAFERRIAVAVFDEAGALQAAMVRTDTMVLQRSSALFASEAGAFGGASKILGPAGYALTAVMAFKDQRERDEAEHPEWSEKQRVAREAAAAGLVTGFTVGGAALGQALIPVPVVGAVVGGVVGNLVGTAVNEHPGVLLYTAAGSAAFGPIGGMAGVGVYVLTHTDAGQTALHDAQAAAGWAGHQVEHAGSAAGHGIEKAGSALGQGAEKAGGWIAGKAGGVWRAL